MTKYEFCIGLGFGAALFFAPVLSLPIIWLLEQL